MKNIVAFDIDGTIFNGPPSFLSLCKYYFNRKKQNYNSKDIEPKKVPPLAKKIDQIDDYGVFPFFLIQKPKNNIVKLIKKISTKNTQLVIISGRGKKLLENITINQLKKHHLLKFFTQIYLKPKTYKSSTTWKFHCLEDFTQNYKDIYLVENDLITSLKIARFSELNKLNIKVLLLKSLETNPKILNLLNINLKNYPNLKLVKNLSNLKL